MHRIWWLLGLVLLLPLRGDAQRHDLPQEDLGIKIASHYGDGSCSSATLNAAISALGSTPTSLVIPPVPRNSITPCTWTLNANVTFPATLRVGIPRGVVLTPAAGRDREVSCRAGCAGAVPNFQRQWHDHRLYCL